MEPKELAMRIAQVLDNKKATRVKVLRVHDLTVLADYFVIASGTSSTHVKSLAEEAEFQMKEAGAAPCARKAFPRKTGLFWITAALLCMCSAPMRGIFTTLSICGLTART